MSMLSVVTLMGLTLAHVKLDILGMAKIALAMYVDLLVLRTKTKYQMPE